MILFEDIIKNIAQELWFFQPNTMEKNNAKKKEFQIHMALNIHVRIIPIFLIEKIMHFYKFILCLYPISLAQSYLFWIDGNALNTIIQVYNLGYFYLNTNYDAKIYKCLECFLNMHRYRLRICYTNLFICLQDIEVTWLYFLMIKFLVDRLWQGTTDLNILKGHATVDFFRSFVIYHLCGDRDASQAMVRFLIKAEQHIESFFNIKEIPLMGLCAQYENRCKFLYTRVYIFLTLEKQREEYLFGVIFFGLEFDIGQFLNDKKIAH
ncbi:hypothetical protein ACJX0J_038993 [Zea mays]